ncbi:hypothetical protein AWB80_01304 [Caballeronia pedi]|uniref:Uncharacterized protein n=2 Tax=Caballeronia pedi TaxID=1777141 RepID=A0A157ZU99_9BURK|nr:hypothetical protein AWB80_01304 [Caballeronia pedi]
MERFNPLKSRLAACLVIAVVALVLIVLSKYVDAWWSGLLQNFGSGLLTSLLLIVAYDRILEIRQQTEAKKREQTGLRKLNYALSRHIRGILFDIYRSSTEAQPVPALRSYRDFVKTHFAQEAQHLNILATSPASYPVQQPYADWIGKTHEVFQQQLQRWIAAYAPSVSANIGMAVEDVLESEYMRGASQFAQLSGQMQATRISVLPFFNQGVCQNYADRLCAVIDYVEASTGQPVGEFENDDWHNALYPVSHARVHNGPLPH